MKEDKPYRQNDLGLRLYDGGGYVIAAVPGHEAQSDVDPVALVLYHAAVEPHQETDCKEMFVFMLKITVTGSCNCKQKD